VWWERSFLGIEGGSQEAHGVQVFLPEQQSHEVPLLGSDAMLAADHSPRLHADAQDLRARLDHPGQLVGITAVERDVRVEIPIARVEDVRELEAALVADLADPRQGLGESCSRHHRVMHVEIRCQPPHGAEGTLARAPEALALGVISRHLHALRTPGLGQPSNALHLTRQRGRRPVELHE
jgi:hypothetical protein